MPNWNGGNWSRNYRKRRKEMPTDSYPLHPDQAQPYYMTIPVEEYEALKKRIQELEKKMDRGGKK